MKTIKELKKSAMIMALRECGGDKYKAAQGLGINLRTLELWMKEHEIECEVRTVRRGRPRNDMKPGGDEAVDQGCLCDPWANTFGVGIKGQPGKFKIAPDCHLHGRALP